MGIDWEYILDAEGDEIQDAWEANVERARKFQEEMDQRNLEEQQELLDAQYRVNLTQRAKFQALKLLLTQKNSGIKNEKIEKIVTKDFVEITENEKKEVYSFINNDLEKKQGMYMQAVVKLAFHSLAMEKNFYLDKVQEEKNYAKLQENLQKKYRVGNKVLIFKAGWSDKFTISPKNITDIADDVLLIFSKYPRKSREELHIEAVDSITFRGFTDKKNLKNAAKNKWGDADFALEDVLKMNELEDYLS